MIGGLRGTASTTAIAALLCAGAAVFVPRPAVAADLGGDCCADLEERVAELEATTARKGNKKVSVQIYGKVNWAGMFWDDGSEDNFYVVNNYNESTRTGIKGKAKINGDLEAGYRLEWEYRHGASSLLNQFNDDGPLSPNIVVRWSQMYVASKNYGTVNWGLTATPKYDITKQAMEYLTTIKGESGGLSDTLVSDFRMQPNFRLRPKGLSGAEGLSTLTWSNIGRCYGASDQFNCSTRRNGVAYSTPDFKGILEGFNLQWGWFEDDDWGGALRYKRTFNDTWKLSGGVAYENLRDERLQNAGGGIASGNVPIPQPNGTTLNKTTFFQRDFDEWAGSLGLMHVPSGLFVVGVFSTSESNDTNAIGFYTHKRAPDMTAWDVQAGIDRKWFAPGPTSFWGGYAQVNDGFAQGSNGGDPNDVCLHNPGGGTSSGCVPGGNLGGVAANGVLRVGTFANIDTPVQITGSEVTRWFLALDQSFESAAMHLYLAYQHFDADIDLVTQDTIVCNPKNPTDCRGFGKLRKVPEALDNFDLFYAGGRMYF
jgi:predicted porin